MKPNRKNFTKKISTDELFTGAKTPEYAVFYNIAYWWMSDTLKQMYKSSNSDDKEKALDSSPYVDRFLKDGESLGNSTLSDSAYLKLRDFLWKGFLFDKNKSGEILTEKDKHLIHAMMFKLNEIRNFHSHYWHDNSNLVFSEELKKWIDNLHEYAILQLEKENIGEVKDYLKTFRKQQDGKISLFDKHDAKYFITQEGRNFFLSFFLKKSEMTRFMQHRPGCKRNDKPEFKIKHLVYRFYCHRDGATKNRYSVENTIFSELDEGTKTEILQARQLYRMLTYLNDIPTQVIDKKLFPLFYQREPVTNSIQFCGLVKEHGLLRDCDFDNAENYEEGKKEITFSWKESEFNFILKLPAFHKVILDIIRDSKSEKRFYEKLRKFSDFRNEFPGILDEFINGNSGEELLNEYYTFKLRAGDKVRGKLAALIDKSQKQTKTDQKACNDLKALAATEPIELNYYDSYFEEDYKPRPANRFLDFAVNYLIDFKVLEGCEWLLEKFEPEEVEKTIEGKTVTKKVVKQIKEYSEKIPDGYRLCIKNGHVLLRLKSNPEIIFGAGENFIRNLLLIHFHKKNINEVFQKASFDIIKIKQAGKKLECLDYAELSLFNDKTLPHYLKLMMQDKKVVENENLLKALAKADKRISNLVEYFEKLYSGEETLTRKEINTQIIRCYKFFEWVYPEKSEFKFLRQDEYRRMSIYHYMLAKSDNSPRYLRNLRSQLFTDIDKHLPSEIRTLLNTATTLDGLFSGILHESISLLKNWKSKLPEMGKDAQKKCLKKLGIHVPVDPVPVASIKTNLGQMKNLPVMLHPALPFMAFSYSRDSSVFSKFRENPEFSKGLVTEHYIYEPYLEVFNQSNGNTEKQIHKIIGEINKLKTIDTLIWMMAKVYLKQSTSGIINEELKKIVKESGEEFRVNQLHSFELPVFTSAKNIEKSFKVMVQFKQLSDFMLVSKKLLKKLVWQIFYRYNSDEKLKEIGIELKNSFYEIPYVLIKQETDRVFHGALMMSDFLLDWEKGVVENIDKQEKHKIAEIAKAGNKRAYIDFETVCNKALLNNSEAGELKTIRNKAFHADIPEGWSYSEKTEDDRIKKILRVTSDKLKKYEKKDAFYEAKALETNE